MFSFILITILAFAPFNIFTNTQLSANLLREPAVQEDNSIYSFGPELTAKSAIVVDTEDTVLFSKNPEEQLPIASLTKLMTALVFLENKTKNWEDWITVLTEDSVEDSAPESENKTEAPPAKLSVTDNEKIKLKDVFYGCLIESANNAAKILARLTKIESGKNFSDLMNQKARDLNMEQTLFFEPTGLDPRNYSTAKDLAKLVKTAMQKEEIKQALSHQTYDMEILKEGGVSRHLRIKSTNKLLHSFINLIGGKTGYLDESGYCFAGQDKDSRITVILGAASDQARFQEAKALFWWASSREH